MVLKTEVCRYLRSCNAPRVLPIKTRAKVLIICNLPNGLVNGLSGTVVHFNDDMIEVQIDQDDNLKHPF